MNEVVRITRLADQALRQLGLARGIPKPPQEKTLGDYLQARDGDKNSGAAA
jgi:hypothetical protein